MTWGNTEAYFGIFPSNFHTETSSRNCTMIHSSQIGFCFFRFFSSFFSDDTRKSEFSGILYVTLKKKKGEIIIFATDIK